MIWLFPLFLSCAFSSTLPPLDRFSGTILFGYFLLLSLRTLLKDSSARGFFHLSLRPLLKDNPNPFLPPFVLETTSQRQFPSSTSSICPRDRFSRTIPFHFYLHLSSSPLLKDNSLPQLPPFVLETASQRQSPSISSSICPRVHFSRTIPFHFFLHLSSSPLLKDNPNPFLPPFVLETASQRQFPSSTSSICPRDRFSRTIPFHFFLHLSSSPLLKDNPNPFLPPFVLETDSQGQSPSISSSICPRDRFSRTIPFHFYLHLSSSPLLKDKSHSISTSICPRDRFSRTIPFHFYLHLSLRPILKDNSLPQLPPFVLETDSQGQSRSISTSICPRDRFSRTIPFHFYLHLSFRPLLKDNYTPLFQLFAL